MQFFSKIIARKLAGIKKNDYLCSRNSDKHYETTKQQKENIKRAECLPDAKLR